MKIFLLKNGRKLVFLWEIVFLEDKINVSKENFDIFSQ